MTGGGGDDTYYVDHAGDTVIELADGGTDHVYATVSYQLPDHVEFLTLLGSGAFSATGNALNNTLIGNGGANTIDGAAGNDTIRGGEGADAIRGGDGNDSLFGEDGNDVIHGGAGNDTLNGGAGTDQLFGGAGNDGLFGGGGNDSLYGEAGNDIIYGDGGNDVIFGGAGDDLMFGGQTRGGISLGSDTFAWARSDIVNANGNRVGYDTISDFMTDDRLDFSRVFTSSEKSRPVSDLIRVSDSAAGLVVTLNLGASAGWVDTVVLSGISGWTLDDFTSQSLFIL